MRMDVFAAARGLLRSPGFTAAAAITLGLGIGANTLMYSVVHSVLLRPIPGYETDRIVRIHNPDDRSGVGFVPPEVFDQIRKRSRSLETVAANQFCRVNLTGLGEPEQLVGPCVTADWFTIQRASAMLGRTFLPDEDQHGRNHVAVLGYGYWQRRFGSDPKILGRTLRLNGEAWVVAGVMRPEFRAMGLIDYPIYTAYVPGDHADGVNVYARLRSGHTVAGARADLKVIASQLARTRPEWKHLHLTATPVLEDVTGPQRPLLLLLLGAVSFVFLIACVNVANLLLARSTVRRHEISVRLAMGASHARILRFFFAEALLIASGGVAIGLVLAYGGSLVVKPLTAILPRGDELSVDVTVLLRAAALGVGAAVFFGIVPPLLSLRTNGVASMRSRSSGSRWQRLLLTAEVALSFVLLAGAALMIQTFVAMRSADLGYDSHNVLTTFLALPPTVGGDRTVGVQLYSRIRERIAGLHGVETVATASTLPMFGVSISLDVQPEGQPARHREHEAAVDVVSDGYFRAMRIPLRDGRMFGETDRAGSRRVAVVSESIARRYFDGKAVGRRLVLPDLLFNIDAGEETAPEIVGVVGNVCTTSVEERDSEHIYLPEAQQALRMENIVVRTSEDPKGLADAVRRAVYEESPMTPIDAPVTLEERTAFLTDGPKRSMFLLSVFAGLALLLAMFGIYSVASYLVAQRKREIGIRIAVGARSGHIAWFVYGSTLPSVFGGLVVGAVAALGLASYLKSAVFGVSATDPFTMTGAAAALLGVAALAILRPALAGTVVDPVAMLRGD